jgi:hypothetical protein
MLEKLFGANWRTSLSGTVTLVSAAVAFKPELINFIHPQGLHDWIAGICGIIAFVSGGAFVLAAKDKKVTGGSVQQTVGGNVAAEGTQSLVDETVKASMKSGEQVTPEQHQAVQS